MLRPDDIDDNWLIGAVCLKENWRFFAGSIGEWILDWAKYQPLALADPDFEEFRGGIAVANTPVAEEFIKAMEPYEVSPDDLCQATMERDPWPLVILVNFDAKLFVDGTRDMVEFTDYVPDGWTAIECDPLNHVPRTVLAIWRP